MSANTTGNAEVTTTRPVAGAPRLSRGGIAPSFILPSTDGGQTGPGALRNKYNMVLVFLDGTAGCHAYLRALSDQYSGILNEEARILAVLPLNLGAARELSAQLNLPFPLLADEDGSTARRMLGPGVANAICVADRFGEIFDLQVAAHAPELPLVRSVLEWLEYIQAACPE